MKPDEIRIVRTRSGARMMQHGCVLSVTLKKPGPTHSVFDVLATLVHLLAPGPNVVLLGFAAGGVIPPLRALGGVHAVTGIDLDRVGHDLFREYDHGWHGAVTFRQENAVSWLRRTGFRWDMIIDDLSVEIDDDVVKPAATFNVLPALISKRLARDGLVMTNWLPDHDLDWKQSIAPIIRRHSRAVAVQFDEFQNRIVVAGSSLASASLISRRLNKALFALGSRQARRVSVRTLK